MTAVMSRTIVLLHGIVNMTKVLKLPGRRAPPAPVRDIRTGSAAYNRPEGVHRRSSRQWGCGLCNNPQVPVLWVLLASVLFGTTGTARALGLPATDPVVTGAARGAIG